VVAVTEYGLPRGASVSYGQQGAFPSWIYALCDRFNLKASTYPDHQTSERPDIGATPNPQRQNRGVDWVGSPDDMLRFAKWLRDTGASEMTIFQDPRTGEQVGYPAFVDYSGDYSGHTDHVHTRFASNPIDTQPESGGYAQAIIAEGQRRRITPRGIQIALAAALVESGNPLTMWANSSVPDSVNYPHDAVGHDHDSVGLFQQRQSWGPTEVLMDPARSAGLFYDQLARLDYNGPNTPGSYAQAVQRSAFPDRYDQRMSEAQQLYDRFVTAGYLKEDDMAQVPQDQWDTLYRTLMDPVPSTSALREPGEGPVGSPIQLLRNTDGMTHIMLVELLARLGSQSELGRLQRVAATLDPTRADDAALAATILDRIYSGDPVMVTTPAVSVTPVSVTPTVTPTTTQGALLGNAYDALEALRLSSTLPPEANAPLHALIDVLQTYPEETR